MGADLIITCMEYPHDAEGKPLPASPELAKQILARVKAQIDTFESVEDFHNNGYWPDNEDDDLWREVPENVTTFVNDTFGEGYASRELASFPLKGVWYIFTGGMSWGDEPTDAMTPVNFLSCLGVTEEPFELVEQ